MEHSEKISRLKTEVLSLKEERDKLRVEVAQLRAKTASAPKILQLVTQMRTMETSLTGFSSSALVEAGYLRHIPVDPFTKEADTWQLVFEENADDDEAGGIFDVHSGSDEVAISGTAYSEW